MHVGFTLQELHHGPQGARCLSQHAILVLLPNRGSSRTWLATKAL